jgi:hypothetical protein
MNCDGLIPNPGSDTHVRIVSEQAGGLKLKKMVTTWSFVGLDILTSIKENKS